MPKAVTSDTLKQDLPQVVAFLRALEVVAPGRVPEELVAELDGVMRNQLALELLAQRLAQPR